MKKVSKSIDETDKIAKFLLKNILSRKDSLGRAMVVGLHGNLGAGKTAFTKIVARNLGISGKISSPTFVIMKKYPIRKNRYKFLFHIDAYRLKNEQELLNLGWSEIIENKDNLVFIEWPENVIKVIPKNSKFIYISINKEGNRDFVFK